MLVFPLVFYVTLCLVNTPNLFISFYIFQGGQLHVSSKDPILVSPPADHPPPEYLIANQPLDQDHHDLILPTAPHRPIIMSQQMAVALLPEEVKDRNIHLITPIHNQEHSLCEGCLGDDLERWPLATPESLRHTLSLYQIM